MSSELIIILFILLEIFIPIISGPIAALIYIYIMKNNNPQQQILFWILFLLWKAYVFFLMVYSLGDLEPGPGLVSCLLTPITAVLAFIILWRAQDEVQRATDGDLSARRNYQFGLFLIPTIQILTLIAVFMLGPFMCELGFHTCTTF